MAASRPFPDDYPQLLERLKREIGAARTRAVLAVNEELIRLYWRIGKEILERQQQEGRGSKVIDRLSADLRLEFPGMRGLSVRNLKYIRAFAEYWPAGQIGPQPVAQLPWGHIRCLLDKLPENERLGAGTPSGRSRRHGRASFSNTTSRPDATSARARRSRTSRKRFRGLRAS